MDSIILVAAAPKAGAVQQAAESNTAQVAAINELLAAGGQGVPATMERAPLAAGGLFLHTQRQIGDLRTWNSLKKGFVKGPRNLANGLLLLQLLHFP